MTTSSRTLLALIVLSFAVGCGGGNATSTLVASNTPRPTPIPSSTPAPTIAAQPTATSTPTNTPLPPPEAQPTATLLTNPCAGLGGEIEVRVLAGPAEVVGLEPFAVGSSPFAVTTNEAPFFVTGVGPISYADILVREWGTYEVTMDLQTTITGECVPDDNAGTATLQLDLEMAGSQLVKVEAEGFQGEYPWEGSTTFNLTFPLEEGATTQGEGWALVLHLNNP